MLELDDTTLARIAIAATAIPAESRSRWLADIARRLERPRQSSPAGERQRRYRARQRTGRILLPIEVDEVGLTEAFLSVGLLLPQEVDDRAAIGRAVSRFLNMMCR